MTRILPLGILLLTATAAQAQQTDVLSTRPPALVGYPDASLQPDTFRVILLKCGAVGIPIIQVSPLPLLATTIQPMLSRVAGVQVTPYSGAPGALAVVRIRGAASLSNNAQPLYVVDGAPVFQDTFRPDIDFNNNNGFQPVESVELTGNPLLSIPVEDIEQVEVLKGALETARYGSQGINGVIRITTRRGRTGAPRLQYSGSGGVQQVARRYDLLNAPDYAALVNDVQAGRGAPPRYSAADIAALGKGTDWQDEILRPATMHEHHLNLSGGTTSTRYYAGTNFLRQNGVLLNSDLSRYSARAAVEQQLGPRLQLSAGASLAETRRHVPNYYTVRNALLVVPVRPVRNPDGTFHKELGYDNPVQLAEESYQTPRQRYLLARAEAAYQLGPELTLSLRGNLERASLGNRQYSLPFGSFPSGQSGDTKANYQQWLATLALRYAHTSRDGRHALSAALEATEQRWKSDDLTRTYMPGTSSFDGYSSFATQYGLETLLLTAGYTFADRYQVQGSLRSDGHFLAWSNRQLLLPGAQATWHAGKEAFLATSALVSRLDAWVGWGLTAGTGFMGFNAYPGALAFLYQPERNRHYDAGLSLGLLQNRLNVTAQAYSRRTSFLAATTSFPIPGFEELAILNTGFELAVDGSWRLGALQGTTTLAAATNKNRFFHDDDVFISLGGRQHQRMMNGQPLALFHGLQYAGTDAAGAMRFQDTNGDGRNTYQDSQELGSGLPRQLLSVGQQLTYKRLSLQGQLQGMVGHQMLNTNLLVLDQPDGFLNASDRVRNRWTPTNQNTDVPRAGYFLPGGVTTYTLQSGNHLRLSTLTLTLKLWEKEARQVAVWVGGNNLFVLSKYRGYDPNVSSAGSDAKQAGLDMGAYPVARTILLGVRATL